MSAIEAALERSKHLLYVVRSLPADLVGVVAYLVAASLAAPLATVTPVRAIVVAPLLLFVPGYTFVAAVYPRRDSARHGGAPGRSSREERAEGGLAPVERVVLSVGMSVVVLPLLGLGTWVLTRRFSPVIVLGSLVALTLVLVGAAAVRRLSLPPETRFRPRPSRTLGRVRDGLVAAGTRRRALNLALVGAVLLAAGAMTVAFAVPNDGESYTTAMVLTEQDGEYVASGYPTSFTAGEPEQLTVQLTNHERTATTYTVVVGVADPSGGGNRWNELDRFRLSLAAGETVRRQHAVAPTTTGRHQRLSYYVYRGSAPPQPSSTAAYRSLHLWINVTPSGV